MERTVPEKVWRASLWWPEISIDHYMKRILVSMVLRDDSGREMDRKNTPLPSADYDAIVTAEVVKWVKDVLLPAVDALNLPPPAPTEPESAP